MVISKDACHFFSIADDDDDVYGSPRTLEFGLPLVPLVAQEVPLGAPIFWLLRGTIGGSGQLTVVMDYRGHFAEAGFLGVLRT